ncbi:MAG: AAA family ATPase [Myxococcota bacterium]
MGFKKMIKPQFPPRHWSIVGYPGSGKSTFAARMKGEKVVIDADHRFSEVLEISEGDVYTLSDNPSDNVDPDAINRLLLENMPGASIDTIVIDSLTSIITPYIVQAMVDRDNRRGKNHIARFQKKALAMRQIQDAVTRWGTDTLWIYHLQDARDASANNVIRSTITKTEIARLSRCINMRLQIVEKDGQRGIEVLWARRGRAGVTVWDPSGSWEGMPERIEEAVYGGLTEAEQEQIEQKSPRVFRTIQSALTWGVESGGFPSIEAAKAAYEAIKAEAAPESAPEMASLWVEAVRARLTGRDAELEQRAS